jgi:hypothetical protein
VTLEEKYMKKTLVLMVLALFVLSASFVSAQEMGKYGTAGVCLPQNDFDAMGTGFFGGFGMSKPHNDQMSFRGEVSYIHLPGDSESETYPDGMGGTITVEAEWSFSMIPILALVEYHFGYDSPAYAIGGGGFTLVTAEMSVSGGGAAFAVDASSTEMTIVFGGGFKVNEQISIEGRYNMISDFDCITLHGLFWF